MVCNIAKSSFLANFKYENHDTYRGVSESQFSWIIQNKDRNEWDFYRHVEWNNSWRYTNNRIFQITGRKETWKLHLKSIFFFFFQKIYELLRCKQIIHCWIVNGQLMYRATLPVKLSPKWQRQPASEIEPSLRFHVSVLMESERCSISLLNFWEIFYFTK